MIPVIRGNGAKRDENLIVILEGQLSTALSAKKRWPTRDSNPDQCALQFVSKALLFFVQARKGGTGVPGARSTIELAGQC